MKGFVFRLDTVLEQRIRHEQAIQVARFRAVQGRQVAVDHLERLTKQIAADKEGAMAAGQTLDIEARMNLLFYLDRADRVLQQQRQHIGQWDQEVRRVHGQLLQASAHRKALERLRERREKEFRQGVERHFAQELDELVTVRYAGATTGHLPRD